jgi:hypothetical protein
LTGNAPSSPFYGPLEGFFGDLGEPLFGGWPWHAGEDLWAPPCNIEETQ